MKKENEQSMPAWKASLLSGLVVIAGFYGAGSSEILDFSYFLPKASIEINKKNSGITYDSATGIVGPVMANKGRSISRR